MTPTSNSPQREQAVIVAWKRLSTRTELLGRALGKSIWYFPDRLPYLKATFRTWLKILRCRPSVIIVQLPQGPLLLESVLIKKLIGTKVVADVHTGFLMAWEWKNWLLNIPFAKLLSHIDLIIIHNAPILDLLPEGAKKKAIVVYDPWYLLENKKRDINSEKYAVLPASYAPDEPLEEILNAIKRSPIQAKLYVTGNWRRQPDIKKYESDYIKFTDFIPTESYNDLLRNSTVIITGTREEYTQLTSANEALAYEKPLVLSETKTLKSIYGDYPHYYNPDNPESIIESINKAFNVEPDLSIQSALKDLDLNQMKSLKDRLDDLRLGK